MLQGPRKGRSTLAWEHQECRVGAGWAGKGSAAQPVQKPEGVCEEW